MTGKMSSKQRFVRCPKCLNVLPEPADVPVYKCGGCGATLQAKKRNISTVNSTSHRLDNNSSGKQKVDQDFGDQIQEAGSSSNQQLQVNISNDESDQNSDHDAANIAKNGSIDVPSSSKQKQKQLTDDHEASSSSLHKQSPVNSTDEPHRNIHYPRSSTELSGHEDPESSPEATGHTRVDQPQEQAHNDHSSGEQKTKQLSDNNVTSSSSNQKLTVNSTNDHHKPHNSSELSHHEDPDSDLDPDQDHTDDLDQFLSCRHEAEFEETSSEFEESYANKIVRDSDYGSRSSFKSIIADKLLDTRQKKPVNLENDDVLSVYESSDLNHRRIFDRITSNYYGYEGSVSSYDGNEIQNPRRHRIGQIEDEYVDRLNRSAQIHHMNNRLGKQKHRSTEIHRNPNPKLERIELLKKVRELTDQLERTSVSNLHGVNNPARFGRRMAFSGETTAVNRRLDGGTCHHCCPPHDRTFSAQLPRQAQHVCCNGPHFEPNTYYSPRVSVLSTPVYTHPESEFSTPDGGYGYRHRNDVAKPFRSPMKTRYVRPIAKGSPWVTCYRCYKLLELPQSFLVFNKKCHSLRCGACMKVLKFTLLNGMHVSRYCPEEAIAAPPSSEVEDYNELNRSRAGPVSCSDVSFQKSYSTETDRNGFWEFGEERRKATMSRDPSGSSQPSSSKISGRRKLMSEIEVERRPNGSPLHRLMGYSTPSKVIRG